LPRALGEELAMKFAVKYTTKRRISNWLDSVPMAAC